MKSQNQEVIDPRVSVVLLTKDAGSQFRAVLSGIRDQKYEGEVELLVIDSGSSDETPELARRYGDTILEIDPEEFHHSRTRNLGCRKASGEVVVFLTQDAMPVEDNWLQNLVSPIADDEAAVVYGRQIAYSDAKPMDTFFYSYFYPDERQTLDYQDVDDPRRFYLENVFISDVCSAINRSVWESNRFREDVPMSEDKDFALRVLESGQKIVYEPAAAVRHSHNYTLRSMFERRYKDGQAFAQIANNGKSRFSSEGIAYVTAELRFLVANGHTLWIPYALLYDAMHFVGFVTGKIVGETLDS